MSERDQRFKIIIISVLSKFIVCIKFKIDKICSS